MAIKNPIQNQSGFTLIELMVSLAIFGVVLTGVVVMFTSTGKQHTGQEMMMELSQDIRAVKNIMVDELRSAGCNPDKAERMGFLDDGDDRYDTDSNSIHFTRDVDNGDGDQYYEPDGDAGDPNENIRYYRTSDACVPGVPAGAILLATDTVTPGCLRRNTGTGSAGGGGMPLAKNITSLQFRYFDSTNAEIGPDTLNTPAKLDNIRTVAVTIIGQVENTNRVSLASRTWTQQFQVRIRNL